MANAVTATGILAVYSLCDLTVITADIVSVAHLMAFARCT
jgi:hypothetical protein